MISAAHSILLIAVSALITLLTRALPFLLFSGKRRMPAWLERLADKIPPAIIAVLVVYCVRSVSPAAPGELAATFLSLAVVVLLHLWKRNTLLSIAAGTILYMALIRVL